MFAFVQMKTCSVIRSTQSNGFIDTESLVTIPRRDFFALSIYFYIPRRTGWKGPVFSFLLVIKSKKGKILSPTKKISYFYHFVMDLYSHNLIQCSLQETIFTIFLQMMTHKTQKYKQYIYIICLPPTVRLTLLFSDEV